MFAAAEAQVYPGGGGYPPTYPGGTPYPGQGPYPGGSPYPGGVGGRGPSIPVPTRGKQPKKGADDAQPLPNFRGRLKRMDEKTIALEMGDNRILDFKRTGKTKFFKGGDELKTPKFLPGDQISVEGTEEAGGYLTAVNVYWEKGASTETAGTEQDRKDGVVDTWKDAPGSENKPEGSKSQGKETSAEKVGPPARPDPDDPGPPKLKRGGVADASRQRAAGVPADAPANPPLNTAPAATDTARAPDEMPTIRRTGDEDAPPLVARKPADDLIRKAADAALDFTETLPAYVCQEIMARFQSDTRPARWQPIDVVSMSVVFENGKEDYRDITINGKKTTKSMEESGGAWSTGEFGTVLIDLFSPATGADFVFQRDSRIAGINTKMYEFRVDREHSHWTIHSGSQQYNPAFNGSVWIDPQTSRVMRIEMQAHGFPESFPLDTVESATDYQHTRLGDAKQYLLPVHAETLTCQRGTAYCSRNTIDFRNYHKYSGESNITFGAPKDAKDKD